MPDPEETTEETTSTTFNIEWDQDGHRFYETGVDRGVLYPADSNDATGYGSGVAWNGLTSVSESPSGADETKLYADNRKYLSLRAKEEFGATIECYTYPDEWAECDGSAFLTASGTDHTANAIRIGQQVRKKFGFSYRTRVGNDEDFEDYGYLIHLVYNAQASPSQKSYSTINDSPEAITFSYEITTTPIDMPGGNQPASTLVIDCTKLQTGQIAAIEALLYGSGSTPGKLPKPETVISTINSAYSAG